MQQTIFREYDIRGKVGTELVLDEVYDLAQAIATYLRTQQPTIRTIAIGMDGRIHSPAIKEETCKAFMDNGLDVVFIGVCPTPVLYFALHTQPVDAGIMITASHNPKEYNGMKICLGTDVVWGQNIQTIKELFQRKQFIKKAPARGSYKELPLISTYIAWLVKHFPHLQGSPIKAIIDCGNGAAGTVLPQLIEAFKWRNVELLYEEVDGTYPHHEADPTHEKNMQAVKQILATTDMQVGIGLDGDCDRMAPMTKQGYLVPGDILLALFARLVCKEITNPTITFDVKASAALIEELEKLGAVPCMSPSGHSIIKDYMKRHHAVLGGELSCHFFFKDRYFGYDDGIYTMLRLFEALMMTGSSLDELVNSIPKKYSSPEYRIACPDNKKAAAIKAVQQALATDPTARLLTIDGVRATWPEGWGLIRASNTQSALTIRFEAQTPEQLTNIKARFIAILSSSFDKAWLAEQLAYEDAA